jgi:hypothetical protein
MSIKIIVASHKKYRMPNDKIYLPLHVGAEGKNDFGFEKDNSGENISSKNPFFCELTGLYWAWKNLNDDYIGLAHYRRHFTKKTFIPKSENKKFEIILNEAPSSLIKTNGILICSKHICSVSIANKLFALFSLSLSYSALF